MAGRPPKKGINYAGWSVDIFDNDTKIDKLLDAYGWDGFGIYFYLCQRAYGGEGYFYQWSYDDCASTSRKMGGGIGSGTVRETVGYCLQIGLFDKRLFDRWGVLTSRGIQRRYWEVVKGRDVRTVISDYWLLQDDECKGLLKTPLNSNLSEGNANFPAGNTNYPEGNANSPSIKESKVNKSKVNNNARAIERFDFFWCCYPLDKNRYLAEQAYITVLKDTDYTEDDLVESAKNYAEYCKITGTDKIYHASNFLSKAHFEDYLPGKYKKPCQKKSQNSFNKFEQNEYDFEKLEDELLSN